MALPNPTALTNATRFRPANLRAHSRSPSRSPVRKAQFTAQHLDPLLSNLSPDSTLKALQATDTIPAGSREETLAKSIADASPSEREIGIRAAFAAQKLRQWRTEVSSWVWPGRRERGLGIGFLSPHEEQHTSSDGSKHVYLGCLTLQQVDHYEQRLDELRDELESLEMDEIKDHVLASHASNPDLSSPTPILAKRDSLAASYGRMRDFTALITATVIQALPDLAILSMLLDTWDVRLQVLRQLPTTLDLLDSTERRLYKESASLREPQLRSQLSSKDFELMRAELGRQVSDLGQRIDKLLDLLEGHEDSLPQPWVDMLENIELRYAGWKNEAQSACEENERAKVSSNGQYHALVTESPPPPQDRATKKGILSTKPPLVVPKASESRQSSELVSPIEPGVPQSLEGSRLVSPIEPSPDFGSSKAGKIPLKLELPPQSGHRREISEVSLADSTLSELSKAEIVDARSTEVLASPRISVVDNPLPPTPTILHADIARPEMVQRASTASIDVVSKEQLKTVDLRRSISGDLLAKWSESLSPESTPSKALQQLTERPITGHTPLAELEDPVGSSAAHERSLFEASSATPTQEQPFSGVPNGQDDSLALPALPRKSSKRASLGPSVSLTPIQSLDEAQDPATASRSNDVQSLPRKQRGNEDSLEDKIQDILLTLPTRIKLSRDSDVKDGTHETSNTSTRASTPTPALTLSPVKTSRKSAVSDTGVRVFHLTPTNQARDAPPIKLFVRAVGENGERVMVRVGGGWADLGEYLREYSAHHGRHSVTDGKMEVAQYPGQKDTASATVAGARQPNVLHKRNRKRGSSASQGSVDTATGEWKRGHNRNRSRTPSPPPPDDEADSSWTPPPVPPIPTSYTIRTPTVSTISSTNGPTETKVEEVQDDVVHGQNGVLQEPAPPSGTSTMHAPGMTTTTTVSSPPANNAKYTPLGAAGPIGANRRTVSHNATASAGNEAWVQGMMGKARAVSGSNVTTIQSPTITTTTTFTSAPSSRRASAILSSPTTLSRNTSEASSHMNSPESGRRKSRLGLGDVSGIKRVFLRRKSEKA